jgi:hypothetical protein
MALDGKCFGSKLRQQSGHVAGTGADFENFIGGLELKSLKHNGNDVGLRDGLVVADRKRMIFVGLGTIRFWNKFVAGDAKHGIKDAPVGDTAGSELGIDHELAGSGGIVHLEIWQCGTPGMSARTPEEFKPLGG